MTRSYVLAAGVVVSLVVGGPLALSVPSAVATSSEPASETEPSASSPEARAMAEARASDSVVEVDELTSETQRVYANPETGYFEAELSPVPVRVAVGNDWMDVDSSLVERGGRLAADVSPVPMSFSAGGDDILAVLGDGKERIELDWPGSLPTPLVEGPAALYPGVLPDVDLAVVAGVQDFATYLIVHSAQAAANPELDAIDFDLTTVGAEITATRSGQLQVADGSQSLELPPLRMWDSAGKAEAASADIEDIVSEAPGAASAELSAHVDGERLTLETDKELLRAEDTVYPVIIDPSYNLPSLSKEDGAWAMVWSNGLNWFNSTTDAARVGYDGWSGQAKRSRVFYRFGLRDFHGKIIKKATLTHRITHSPNWTCDLASYGPEVQVHRTEDLSGPVSWPGPSVLGLQDSNGRAPGHSTVCSSRTAEWNVTKGVSNAVESDVADRITLGMRSAGESNRDGWRQLATRDAVPRMTVVYNSPPKLADTAPSIDQLSNGFIPRGTVTFRAKVEDPDGHQSGMLRARFEIYRNGTGVLERTVVSDPVSSGSVAVKSVNAPSLFDDGQRYFVQVRAVDEEGDAAIGNPPNTYFTTDFTVPDAPRVELVSPDVPLSANRQFQFRMRPGANDTGGDISTYHYSTTTDTPNRSATAPSLGSSVTVDATYADAGRKEIVAFARDRAGNQSLPGTTGPLRVMTDPIRNRWLLNTVDIGLQDRWFDEHLVAAVPPTYEADLPDGNEAFAGSLEFAGTQHLSTAPGVASLLTNQSFSIGGWFKLDPAASGQSMTLFSKALVGTTNAFEVSVGPAGWRGQIRNAQGQTSIASIDHDAALPHGRWIYVLFSAGGPDAGPAPQVTLRLYAKGYFGVDEDGESTVVPSITRSSSVPAVPLSADSGRSLVIGADRSGSTPAKLLKGRAVDVRSYQGFVAESQFITIRGETGPTADPNEALRAVEGGQ